MEFAFGCLDDLLIFNNIAEEHLTHLLKLFKCLRDADLKLKKKECNFIRKQLHDVGHLLSGEGIYSLPDKLKGIETLSVPKHQRMSGRS